MLVGPLGRPGSRRGSTTRWVHPCIRECNCLSESFPWWSSEFHSNPVSAFVAPVVVSLFALNRDPPSSGGCNNYLSLILICAPFKFQIPPMQCTVSIFIQSALTAFLFSVVHSNPTRVNLHNCVASVGATHASIGGTCCYSVLMSSATSAVNCPSVLCCLLEFHSNPNLHIA